MLDQLFQEWSLPDTAGLGDSQAVSKLMQQLKRVRSSPPYTRDVMNRR